MSEQLKMTTALTINQLSVELQDKSILKDFSLSLDQGDILCLLGPSGCGKTTALKAIAGLLPCQGEVQLFDKTLLSKSRNTPPEKRNMGFIFQDYALFPHMTVAENIAYGLKGQSKDKIEETVNHSLELVHLDGLGDRFPHQLSGGQQQRTAVARALANRPKLLLMDEPFSNIDSQVKQSMMAELRHLLKAHNITCIFVTHSKQEAFSFADKTAILNNGSIEQVDRTQMIYEFPKNKFVANFMEAGNLLPCNRVPEGLLSEPTHCGDGDYLLRENGFAFDGEARGTVVDSLYMGFRYRNEIKINEQTIYVESKDEIPKGELIPLRYVHHPVLVS